MATKYWYGGTGNWNDGTTHWSLSSGNSGSNTTTTPTMSDDAIFDANSGIGTVTFNTPGVSCNNLDFSNSSILTIAGNYAATCWANLTLKVGMTITWTGTMTMSQSSGTAYVTSAGNVWGGNFLFSGGGATNFILMDDLTIQNSIGCNNATLDCTTHSTTVMFKGNGNISLNTSSSFNFHFYNLTIFPTTPSKTGYVNVYSDWTIDNIFKIDNGATVTNRMLVYAPTQAGIARTITCNGSLNINNTDWMDITGAGSISWDMSSMTGGSGNCGGNTMKSLGDAAFTTPVTQHYLNSSTSSWSTASNWTSRTPLPQDNVVMDRTFGTSQTITGDMPRLGKSIDWSGASWSGSIWFSIPTNSSIFGSLILKSGMTAMGSVALTFYGRGTTYYLTCNGSSTVSWQIVINAPTGTYYLGSAYIGTTTFTLQQGTLDTQNYDFTTFNFQSAYTTARTLNMGSSIWTINGTSGNSWSCGTTTNFTLNCGTSTIKMLGVATSYNTFAGGDGMTYYNLYISRGTSTYEFRITYACTFNNITCVSATSHNITFPSYKITTVGTFTMVGSAGVIYALKSDTAGVRSYIRCTTGTINCNYITVQDLQVFGGATWNIGANSTFVSNTAGWSSQPATPTRYWVAGGTGNWSSTTNWSSSNGGGSGASVPTGECDVYFTSLSGSGISTMDVATSIHSLDFNGFTGTFTGTLALIVNGNIRLASGMTYSHTGSLLFQHTFETKTITSATKTLASYMSIGNSNSNNSLFTDSWTLQDAFVTSSTSGWAHFSGTFDSNDYNFTCVKFQSAGTTLRTLYMRSSTWECQDLTASTFLFRFTTTGLTLYPGISTIKITGNTSNGRYIDPNGVTLNLVWFAATGNGYLLIYTSGTYAELRDTGTVAHTLYFQSPTTQTYTLFTVNGTLGQITTITSNPSTGTVSFVKNGGGTIISDYLSIQHMVCTPANTWFYGSNSTLNNTTPAGSGWLPTPQNINVIDSLQIIEGPTNISYNTSANPPGTVTQESYGAIQWVNTENIKVEDGSFTTMTLAGQTPYQLDISNFGFSIPSNATVTGIKLEIKGMSTNSGFLSVFDFSEGSGYEINLTSSNAWQSFGGPTQTWDMQYAGTLNPTYINSSAFGFGILPGGGEDPITDTFSLDSARVTVYYNLGGVPLVQTSSLLIPINIFDTLNISENLSDSENALQVNIYDTLNISESIIQNLGLNGINIYDTLNISENLGETNSNLNINIYDTLNIAQNVTINTTLKDISVFDSLNISDIVNDSTLIIIYISDSLNISESVTLSNPNLGGINIYDTLNISQNVTESISMSSISIYDSLNISESTTLSNPNLGGINIYDTLNISDIFNSSSQYLVSIYDSINISESVTINLGLVGINIYDTLNISQVPTLSNTNLGGINLYDSINISENLSDTEATLQISIYDTLNISESVTQNIGLTGINIYDSLNISENLSDAETVLQVSVYDTLNIADLFNSSSQYLISIFDSINISESITINLGLVGINVYDTLNISQNVTENISSSNINVYDTLNISQNVTTTTSSPIINIYDTLNISQNVIENLLLSGVSVYDSLNINESFTEIDLLNINVSDSITVVGTSGNSSFDDSNVSFDDIIVDYDGSGSGSGGDYVDVEIISFVNKVDTLNISESITIGGVQLGSINIFDSINISENAQVVKPLIVSVSDTINISELVTVTVPNLGNINIYDTLNISQVPTLSNPNLGGINIYDTLNISENLSDAEQALQVSIYDTLNISENVTTITPNLGGVNIYDILNISQVPILSNPNLGEISIYDTLNISQSVTLNTLISGINIYDSINISENVSLLLYENISVVDTLNISESINLGNQLGVISVFDTLNISENEFSTEFLYVNISDALNISENAQGVSSLPNISVFDTLEIDEMSSTGSYYDMEVHQVVNISELVTISNPNLGDINVFDLLNISEYTNAKTSDLNISIFDSISISENLNETGILSVSVSDTLNIGDFKALNDLLNVSVFDSLTITNVNTIIENNNISVFDSIRISENYIDFETINLNIHDTVTITDIPKPEVVCNIKVNDQIIITEKITMKSFRFSPSIKKPLGSSKSIGNPLGSMDNLNKSSGNLSSIRTPMGSGRGIYNPVGTSKTIGRPSGGVD